MQPKPLDEYACRVCQFELWHPLAELEASVLGFYDDARFPGRCILAYREHADDFASLGDEERNRFMGDVADVGRAIKLATGADRINYAILGNTVPHLHMHLIPRMRSREPLPNRPPWEDPRPKLPVPPQESRTIKHALLRELGLLGSASERAELKH